MTPEPRPGATRAGLTALAVGTVNPAVMPKGYGCQGLAGEITWQASSSWMMIPTCSTRFSPSSLPQHVIERAGSGLAALDVIEGKRIDLLLTDVLMPGLHGFNLARMGRLRTPELRVLYISGFMEIETIVQDEGPRLGKLLSKPIAPAELRREIAEALAAPPAP
jgi:CheY-like chemotaxis protein